MKGPAALLVGGICMLLLDALLATLNIQGETDIAGYTVQTLMNTDVGKSSPVMQTTGVNILQAFDTINVIMWAVPIFMILFGFIGILKELHIDDGDGW